MKLLVLSVGKLRDAAVVGLCDEYVKRSRAFIPMQRGHVSDRAGLWSKAGDSTVVLLDERGEQINSVALSGWLQRWRDRGVKRVTFGIGDSHGFEDDDRERADALLGLSLLTLPHRLAYLVLCEQLYRAGTILAGHPYHHA